MSADQEISCPSARSHLSAHREDPVSAVTTGRYRAKPGSTVLLGLRSGSDSRNTLVVLENRSCLGTNISSHEGHPVDASVSWLQRRVR